MFTGIIRELGIIESITATASGRRIAIACNAIAADALPGESVCVNGVCLTVVECVRPGQGRPGLVVADVLDRTWELTNMSGLRPGRRVNLEPAMRLGDRIGGHFVLGHIDGCGMVVSRAREGGDVVLGIRVGRELAGFLVPRGSIAVDGVSLTIAEADADTFSVHLVPHTLRTTTLGERCIGDPVNIEGDVLSRYAKGAAGVALSEEFLKERGFI